MRKLIILLMLVGCLSVSAQVKVKESKTTFAREALQPYLDKGTLAGPTRLFYKNGVRGPWCIG